MWLAAACASIVLALTAVSGTLLPLQHPDGVEYLFVQPPLARVLWLSAAALPATAAAWWLVARAGRRHPARATPASRGAWLAPLCFAPLVWLGLAPAVPGLGERAAVAGYFFYDLRWWWMAGIAAATIARADRELGSPLASRLRNVWRSVAAARGAIPALAFGLAVAFAVVATPPLRFSASLNGDEPRYLRYCELWYGGGGLDVSRVALVSETRGQGPALAGNARHLARAIGVDARALARDLREAVGHPLTFRWNRATAEDGFVHGIHGGLYQVHQPGVSAVLFPGYVLDRAWLAPGASPDGKFPDALPATNAMMLIAYGLAAVALVELLRRALASNAWALTFGLLGIVSLPASAFAFQFYPELPALVVVLAVTIHLWFPRSTHAGWAALAGLGAGGMAWFHPRFLLLGGICLAVALWRLRGTRRRLFAAAFGAGLLSLMAYDYHVTGSWLPTALWDATGEGVTFTDASVFFIAIGYAIDRTWGVLPHAPIFAAALPGLFILARTTPRHALFVAALTAALVLTAAGHTLSAAGTTPDRLIVAVVPLLAWPAAVAVRATWHRAVPRAVFVVLAVMSLHAAVTYNFHHEKSFGPLRASSDVGWQPNLAFPVMRGDVWSESMPNFVLFLGVAAAICLGTLAIWRAAAASARPAALPRGARAYALTLAAFVVCLSAATSANGDWTSRAYLLDRDQARARMARALVDADPCRLCSSSRGNPVSWMRPDLNSAREASLDVDASGTVARIQVRLDGDEDIPAYARMRVAFGDGHDTGWAGIAGAHVLSHRYDAPGTYPIEVSVRLPTGETREFRQQVAVAAE